MKHDKFTSRNFKKKMARFCKVCKRQCIKGSKFCSTECKEQFNKEPPVWTSPMIYSDNASTSTQRWFAQ